MTGEGLSRRLLLVGGLTGLFSAAGGLTVGAGSAWATEPPPYVDCPGWGARPPARPSTVHPQRPVKILVHHTATPNTADLSRPAADNLARKVQAFHMDRRGWPDTGQHLTISRGGHVLEGRHRSLETLAGGRSVVEGAHCTGQNIVAIGIENEGTYSTVDVPPQLWDRLRQTCAHICSRYGIAPTEIYGHRDFKNTLCPGDRLYARLPALRTEVAGLLGARVEAAAVQKASWPVLAEGATGGSVLAAQHLLRTAGVSRSAPTGVFDAGTDAAVRRLQAGHGAEEVNGLLGAESWPVLVAAARQHPGAADSRLALAALAGSTEAVRSGGGAAGRFAAAPDRLTAPDWQRLLGTAGAPVDTRTDPG